MYAIVSAAIREKSSISPSPTTIQGKENNNIQHEEQERAPAPSRFAAAQQLFRRQQTVPPKPPSPPFIAPQPPTSPSRHRSFTASSSLYSKLGQSIQDTSITSEERTRAESSPEKMSVTESFGQPRPQHVLPPLPADLHEPRPQTPINAACILPGPKYAKQPFDITTVTGTTSSGKSAWWCRHDKLVVFDGLNASAATQYEDRDSKRLIVRSSKGLEMARRNCEKETVYFDVKCGHCRDMIGKESWKYEARVKKGSVCRRCVEKCWREVDRARQVEVEEDKRRDSFLMGEEREVRRIQSQGNLKGEAGVDVLGSGGMEVEITPDLRKVRSDWQLQRVGTASVDEILFGKAVPTQK